MINLITYRKSGTWRITQLSLREGQTLVVFSFFSGLWFPSLSFRRFLSRNRWLHISQFLECQPASKKKREREREKKIFQSAILVKFGWVEYYYAWRNFFFSFLRHFLMSWGEQLWSLKKMMIDLSSSVQFSVWALVWSRYIHHVCKKFQSFFFLFVLDSYFRLHVYLYFYPNFR